MNVISTLFNLSSIVTLFLMAAISMPSSAHDGHTDEDIIIKNLGDLGKVDFSTSCNAQVQQAMNTGVGLLHHMMYAQAEMFFGEKIKEAPDCAMVYWGYSMSLFHPLWPDTIKDEALVRGHAALIKAQQLTSTTREKSYISAAFEYYQHWETVDDKTRIAKWAKAQSMIYHQNPDDIDATAFFALSQIVMAPKDDPKFRQNKAAGELLANIIAQLPTHPGAIHYTIHAFDNPVLAKFAIDAARAYDKIAPDVPHSLHMPSHIFIRLGMWQDAVSWNIRSAKAALKYPTNGATSLHYVHAIDYLVYGYLQLGDGENAKKSLVQVDNNHPIQAVFPTAYALAAIPARISLEQEMWQQSSQIKVRHPDYIPWSKFPQIEAITYYARGLGAIRSGKVALAKSSVEVLNGLYAKTKIISPNYWAPLVDAQRRVILSWIHFEQGEKEKALIELRQAADIEDSIDKNPVTPGAVLPARELLADMLLLNGDYMGALKEYELTLVISPNRLNSVLGKKTAQANINKNN
jgi:tetratricopeptide (TPR) repeat protein